MFRFDRRPVWHCLLLSVYLIVKNYKYPYIAFMHQNTNAFVTAPAVSRQPPRWLFRFACLDFARFRALEVPSRPPPWRIREPDYPC